MDSCWFAVDRDGSVGYFATGEAGARPLDATLEGPYEVLIQLGRVLSPCDAIHDLQGHSPPGPLGQGPRHLHRNMPQQFGGLLFLTSADLVQTEIARGNAMLLPARQGIAVYLRALTPELSQRIHEAGQCLGCVYGLWAEQDEDADEMDRLPKPARIGLYYYSHTTENWISGPYGRIQVPAQPIHIDQLPPDLRRQVRELRLDLRFADTAHIQPVEHAQSASWESAYLTGDGLYVRENVAAIDGRFAPDQYAEFYSEFTGDNAADWLAGITIDPPRDSQ
jgi:hypothetical protein